MRPAVRSALVREQNRPAVLRGGSVLGAGDSVSYLVSEDEKWERRIKKRG